jgi:glycerol-3-phosphate dehydrogenase
MALSVSDLLIRRTGAALLLEGQGLAEAGPVSQVMGEELGWSETERIEQVERYRTEVLRLYPGGCSPSVTR